MSRTLVLLKPDTVRRGLVGEILSRFEAKGLTIVAMEHRTIDAALADQHYAEHVEKDFYPPLRDFVTSGPLVSLVLEGDEAVEVVRALNGATDGRKAAPGTIRGDLSLSNRENLVHGSDSRRVRRARDRDLVSAARGLRLAPAGGRWPSNGSPRGDRGCQCAACSSATAFTLVTSVTPAPACLPGYALSLLSLEVLKPGVLPVSSSPHASPRKDKDGWRTTFVGRDMAVDLGTANTLVYVRGRGILVDEPSVVAVNEKTGELVAVGRDAKQMVGRTPEDITAIRPLQDGVIADFEATEQMLRHFIALVHRRRYLAKPRMVVCVPSGITTVEQRAVKEAGYQAGARRVYIIEEPMAAAIGAGLPVHKATGNMVVDVGGGTTEVAVISLGGIVTSLSVRTAGDELDRAITNWMKKEHALLLGEATAEEVKVTLGSAFPGPLDREAEIRGRDLVSGLPRTVTLTSSDVRTAIEEPLHAILDAVRVTLDQTPPELAGDIMDRGIVLTGGGALLRGLDERLRHETGMPVHVAEDPLRSVALGAGRCVEEFEALQQVLVAERRVMARTA